MKIPAHVSLFFPAMIDCETKRIDLISGVWQNGALFTAYHHFFVSCNKIRRLLGFEVKKFPVRIKDTIWKMLDEDKRQMMVNLS